MEERVLRFRGDQSHALPDKERHYRDGGKCSWNTSSASSALALYRNWPEFFSKESTIECFVLARRLRYQFQNAGSKSKLQSEAKHIHRKKYPQSFK
jgi:hypothetical protein